MAELLKRNGALIVGLIIGGVLMLLCLPLLENARGGYVPAALQAKSMLALPAAIACFAAAAIVAGGVARLTNACVGLFVLGGAVFALDYRLGTVNEILLGGSLAMMIVELLIWTAVGLAAVLLVFRLGGPLTDVHADEDGRTPSPLLSMEALKSAAAGIVVLPVVWLLAQSELKGQAAGSVFIGAVAAAMIGRLLSPHVQPILLFVAPMLFGAIGYIVGLAMADGTPAELFVSRDTPAVLLAAPIDYLCGTLVGVAIGYGWARSFLHHEDEEDESPAAQGA